LEEIILTPSQEQINQIVNDGINGSSCGVSATTEQREKVSVDCFSSGNKARLFCQNLSCRFYYSIYQHYYLIIPYRKSLCIFRHLVQQRSVYPSEAHLITVTFSLLTTTSADPAATTYYVLLLLLFFADYYYYFVKVLLLLYPVSPHILLLTLH
jgi:hypothetical protein